MIILRRWWTWGCCRIARNLLLPPCRRIISGLRCSCPVPFPLPIASTYPARLLPALRYQRWVCCLSFLPLRAPTPPVIWRIPHWGTQSRTCSISYWIWRSPLQFGIHIQAILDWTKSDLRWFGSLRATWRLAKFPHPYRNLFPMCACLTLIEIRTYAVWTSQYCCALTAWQLLYSSFAVRDFRASCWRSTRLYPLWVPYIIIPTHTPQLISISYFYFPPFQQNLPIFSLPKVAFIPDDN